MGKIKKIAFIIWLPTPYRTPLLRKIAEWDDVELKVFYCSSSAPDRDWDLALGESKSFSEILPGKVLNIPFIGKNLNFNPSIWLKLSEGRFDAVIINGYLPFTMVIAIFWALKHNVPYIINSESQLLNKRNLWKSVIKKVILTPIIKRASAYLPNGKYAGEYLIHYGADPKKIFYFPNTPDVEFFIEESDKYRKKKDKIKEELGIDKEYVILFVGRLIKVKDLFTLLRGFKEAKKKFGNVSLLLVGDGVLRNSLEEFIEKKEIEDVHFIGFVSSEELPRYYAISDIFVLPSIYEPWGVVVNEAMASGLPVVLSDKVGSRGDLLKEGENGFSYPSKDYKKLADCILKMLSNPDKSEKMGQKSRGIIQHFGYSFCENNLKRALKKRFESFIWKK